MSFTGEWQVHQKWEGLDWYKFPMSVSADGKVTIKGGFVGVISQLGSSNQMSMAIGNISANSISTYVGKIYGSVMGGDALGVGKSGSSVKGVWYAQLCRIDVPEKGHSIP